MRKRKANQLKLWIIGVLAILLLAASSAWAIYINCTPEGSPYNIEGDDIDGLNISAGAIVNLYTSVSYVFVAPGGILNIYSGSITSCLAINTANPDEGETDAIVTVYGTDFKADWQRDGTIVSLEGATEFTPLSTPTYDLGSILIATDGNGIEMNLVCFSNTPIHLVEIKNEDTIQIDIKPGSDENVINLKSRGVVPVAVLTTDEFNAGTLVPDYSISFAGASPVRSTLCDVDCDGDMDMLFHFRTQQLVDLNEDSTEATLKAMLKGVSMLSSISDEDVLKGTDTVKIKSSKQKH